LRRAYVRHGPSCEENLFPFGETRERQGLKALRRILPHYRYDPHFASGRP